MSNANSITSAINRFKRLTGLLNEDILQEIKKETNLQPFTLNEAATTLLEKIKQCIPSSRKLRTIIRKSMGQNENFDLIEIFDVNFIEILATHYLNLIDSPLSPLFGAQLERTAAVNTTITTLSNLFIGVNDIIGFKWNEVQRQKTYTCVNRVL